MLAKEHGKSLEEIRAWPPWDKILCSKFMEAQADIDKDRADNIRRAREMGAMC